MPNYLETVEALLRKLHAKNADSVQKCATALRECVDGGGLVFVFGSGHSSILVEEAFHRAGGLIPVYPMLYDFLSPHVSPKIAGKMERVEGVAQVLFARAGARKGDLAIIASNSGINAAAIEMAIECKKAAIKTVAVTNLSHSQSVQTRHSSGKKLFELCDFVLDNCCPAGDALTEIKGENVGAGSTIANTFLYNWVLTTACEKWAADGKKLPIYRSANLPGGDAHNEAIEANYRSRIPQL